MKGKSLDKLYDHLLPEERFKLALEALGRCDEEEIERLFSTCPRKTYSMADAGFTYLFEISRLSAAVFCLLWYEASGRLKVAQAIKEGYVLGMELFTLGYAKGGNAAWKEAGQEGFYFDVDGHEPSDGELKAIGTASAVEDFPPRITEIYNSVIGELKGIWEGFSKLCGERQVDPLKVLGWYGPILPEVEDHLRLYSGVEVPGEIVESYYRLFKNNWPDG